jgi:hypothetical protein
VVGLGLQVCLAVGVYGVWKSRDFANWDIVLWRFAGIASVCACATWLVLSEKGRRWAAFVALILNAFAAVTAWLTVPLNS